MESYGYPTYSPYVVFNGVFNTQGYGNTAQMYQSYVDIINGPTYAGIAVPPIVEYSSPMNMSIDFLQNEVNFFSR